MKSRTVISKLGIYSLVILMGMTGGTGRLPQGFAGGDACENICKLPHPSTSSSPTPGASRIPSDPLGMSHDDLIRERLNWAIAGPHCAAISINNTGQDVAIASSILYTAAAVACTTACISEWVPWLAWTKGVCMGTSTVAAVEDLTASLFLESKGKMIESELNWAGFGVGVTGAVMSFTQPAFEAARGFMTAPMSTGAKRITSCATAALMIAAATIKWVNVDKMGCNADKECENVLALIGESPHYDYGSNHPTPSGRPDFRRNGGNIGGGGGGRSPRGSGGGSSGGFNAVEDAVIKDFGTGKFAAATAGPFGTVFNSIPRDAMERAVREAAGMSIGELAKKLRTASPASIVGSMDNLPGGIAASASDIEKSAKEGVFNAKGDGVGSSSMTSGGGAKSDAAKSSANPFQFGMKSPTAGTSGEAVFEKMKKAPELQDNGDVFHEGYAGTIFQIVSGKLDKTRERIEALEWEHPLNRALAGLPVRKDALKMKGVSGNVRK